MYTCSRESATSDMQTVSGKVSIEFNTEGTSARRMIAFVFLACLPLPSLSREKLPLSVDQSDMSKMLAVDFEVFGVVQGVFFRKYTQKRGQELGLTGWCMNTRNGTVVGYLEGEKARVEEMKQWLRHTGSPQSRIDKAEFRNEKEISQPSFSNFQIRK